MSQKRRRSLYEPIDYMSRGNERRKLITFIGTNKVRRRRGISIIGDDTLRTRIIFSLIAAGIILTGTFYVLF